MLCLSLMRVWSAPVRTIPVRTFPVRTIPVRPIPVRPVLRLPAGTSVHVLLSNIVRSWMGWWGCAKRKEFLLRPRSLSGSLSELVGLLASTQPVKQDGRGTARHGRHATFRHGTARHGNIRHGTAGMARPGTAKRHFFDHFFFFAALYKKKKHIF